MRRVELHYWPTGTAFFINPGEIVDVREHRTRYQGRRAIVGGSTLVYYDGVTIAVQEAPLDVWRLIDEGMRA